MPYVEIAQTNVKDPLKLNKVLAIDDQNLFSLFSNE